MGVGSLETQSKALITDGQKVVGSGINSERKNVASAGGRGWIWNLM